MSKDAYENAVPKPPGEALVQERPKPDSAAMRDLVGGGAAYDDRRRNQGRMRVESPSGLIEKFSPEPKRPSAAGLPSWKGDTAPGLGTPAPVENETDEASPTSGRLTKEERDALAKEIAREVRGNKPEAPYRARRLREPEPVEESSKVELNLGAGVSAEKRDESRRASREAETVARHVEERPPETKPERRMERRIGTVALAAITLLVGVFVGRYVMRPSDGGTNVTSAQPTSATSTMAQIASTFPAALTAMSVAPLPSAPTAQPSGSSTFGVEPSVSARPATSAKPSHKGAGGAPPGPSAATPTAPLMGEPKPPSPPTTAPAAPVSTELKPF